MRITPPGFHPPQAKKPFLTHKVLGYTLFEANLTMSKKPKYPTGENPAGKPAAKKPYPKSVPYPKRTFPATPPMRPDAPALKAKKTPEEAPALPALTTFAELNLSEPVARAIADLGFEAPTPIQARSIPLLLAGRDLIGQAQTGTGKTAAFGLPMAQTCDSSRMVTQALVLEPTR